MTPFWFQLLRALRTEPRIAREGSPTIAFLVGATQLDLGVEEIAPDDARRALIDLLAGFLNDAPTSHVSHISRCPVIGQPVLRSVADEIVPYYPAIESEKQQRHTIVLDPEFAGELRPSVGGVAGRLFQELGAHLCGARFSFDQGTYRRFDSYERDFILGTLGR
jgi:hypothetical protein